VASAARSGVIELRKAVLSARAVERIHETREKAELATRAPFGPRQNELLIDALDAAVLAMEAMSDLLLVDVKVDA
jgi:hypothetical protein